MLWRENFAGRFTPSDVNEAVHPKENTSQKDSEKEKEKWQTCLDRRHAANGVKRKGVHGQCEVKDPVDQRHVSGEDEKLIKGQLLFLWQKDM